VRSMSREAKRDSIDLRLLLRFIQEASRTHIVEQVYAHALTAVQELFTPNRAFVALSESSAGDAHKSAQHPGWLLDLSVPIYVGGKLMGQIMLQYDEPRGFSEQDLAMIEVIAAQAGFFIQRVYERKAAEEAQRQNHELVAMAAHELRAPLMAIIGGALLLRAGRDNENVRALDIIDRNARAQITLIEELLQVCQLDARKVELKVTTIDIVPILERVIEDIQASADANKTAIKAALNGPIMLHADSRRLWQIFWNLIANSIRFCPNGELRISADLDSGRAKICIQDDGVGITKDQLPHIFERFRQGHIPRMKSDGGLGLGLAIVKDLVALHGGTINAESDGPGKGACFTVTLPC
jgi:signal transduction histidine kinase